MQTKTPSLKERLGAESLNQRIGLSKRREASAAISSESGRLPQVALARASRWSTESWLSVAQACWISESACLTTASVVGPGLFDFLGLRPLEGRAHLLQRQGKIASANDIARQLRSLLQLDQQRFGFVQGFAQIVRGHE